MGVPEFIRDLMGVPEFTKWARMARIAVGSSMLATIRSVPPQWTQAFTASLKTRLRRCA